MMVGNSMGFNARKAGQVAAFFVLKEGGLLNVVKLVKLIYLADRNFMGVYEEPMFMDAFVSMKHGPVSSRAYESVNSGGEGWDEFISDRANHAVALARRDIKVSDLDDLADADIEVLQETWNAFGHMDQWQLVKYTHENCPEWEDPGETSETIPYSRIFKFLNKENPLALEKSIHDFKRMDKALSRLR